MTSEPCSSFNETVFNIRPDQWNETNTTLFRSDGRYLQKPLFRYYFKYLQLRPLLETKNISLSWFHMVSRVGIKAALDTHESTCYDRQDTSHGHGADNRAQWIQRRETHRRVPVSGYGQAALSPSRDIENSGSSLCKRKASEDLTR